MRRLLACASFVPALAVLSGCTVGFYNVPRSCLWGGERVFAFGAPYGPSWCVPPRPGESPGEIAAVTPMSIATTGGLPANVTPADPRHAPFDATGALARIHEVNLAPCAATAPGAHKVYGHARVRFESRGSASQVLVDAPAGLTDAVATCVGEHLGAVTVPPFEGGAMTVGASYFVP